MPEPAPGTAGTAGPATVTDAFALLGLPRLPWLDPAVVRDQFLAASRDQHPDRHHGSSEAERARVQSAYTGLNAAQQCLRESRTRITHLLELETGARPRDVVQLPAGVNALFGPVGAACHGADQCLREREAARSPPRPPPEPGSRPRLAGSPAAIARGNGAAVGRTRAGTGRNESALGIRPVAQFPRPPRRAAPGAARGNPANPELPPPLVHAIARPPEPPARHAVTGRLPPRHGRGPTPERDSLGCPPHSPAEGGRDRFLFHLEQKSVASPAPPRGGASRLNRRTPGGRPPPTRSHPRGRRSTRPRSRGGCAGWPPRRNTP